MSDNDNTLEPGLFAVDSATRSVRGLLMPWGELSRPAASQGVKTDPIRFDRGRLKLPADPDIVTLNQKHDRFSPFGRASELTDTDQGVVAQFRIARTPEGDAFMTEYQNGKRLKLSAEVRNVRRDPDDPTSGEAELVGAATVPEGAFASAGLFALDGELENPSPVAVLDREEDTDPAPAEPDEPVTPAENQEDSVTNTPATVPAPLQASAPKTKETTQEEAPPVESLFAMMQQAKSTGDFSELQQLKEDQQRAGLFAFGDMKISGANQVGTAAVQAQWTGKLWEGRGFARRIIPALSSTPLQSLTVTGWKWNVEPEVFTWDGNKANITSTSPTATAYTGTAQRFAGGNDIAREFYDFNETTVIQEYIGKLTTSYARKSDAYALAQVAAGATEVDAETYPSGVGDAVGRLVQGALAVVEAEAQPTFAVLASDMWKQLAYTKKDDVLAFLSMQMGLTEGSMANFTILPGASLDDGEVIVGDRLAAIAMELPGVPIRVSALDMLKGGVDEALFGYIHIKLDYPTGIVKVVTPSGA